jgi:hypothetical protein
MRDAISATLTTALDDADLIERDALALALDVSHERRDALAHTGIRVDESPYLHFLRRFTSEAAPPTLVASA